MGQPKLLLPWPTKVDPQGTVLDAVLSAWTKSSVHRVIVVMRDDDTLLQHACERWPVSRVLADQPPADMKASICLGVSHLQQHEGCTELDRCFVAPADLPMLTPQVIDSLAVTEAAPSAVVVPRFGGQSGHPALLPWRMMSRIFDLAEDQGVNQIVDAAEKHRVHFPANMRVYDIDTPEEYRAALELAQAGTSK